MSNLKPLPEVINGFRIEKDLGKRDGCRSRRFCVAECKVCFSHFTVCISTLPHQKSCGCRKALPLDVRDEKRLRNVFSSMKARCCNKNNKDYYRYGGRGISISPEWKSSTDFIRWSLSNGCKDNLSIDRIDNNKGYGPDNCRWATPQEQSQNTRTNQLTEHLVSAIREDLKSMKGVEVAEKYRVSKGQVSSVKLRRTWANIE